MVGANFRLHIAAQIPGAAVGARGRRVRGSLDRHTGRRVQHGGGYQEIVRPYVISFTQGHMRVRSYWSRQQHARQEGRSGTVRECSSLRAGTTLISPVKVGARNEEFSGARKCEGIDAQQHTVVQAARQVRLWPEQLPPGSRAETRSLGPPCPA